MRSEPFRRLEMKILPLILLSLLAFACTSDQQNEEEVIQRQEDIQMQEEELQRTGAAGDESTDPYSTN